MNLTEGLSVANSEYTGRGRMEEAKSYLANCAIYDKENGTLLMRMSGLRFAKLDTGVKADPHVFNEISWKPDIIFMTQYRLDGFLVAKSEKKYDVVIDLVAHEKPVLNVLEINLDPSDSSCMWFEAGDAASRASYLRYDFASSDARNIIGVQTAHENKRNAAFYIINTDTERLGLAKAEYDLVIVKTSPEIEVDVTTLTLNIKPLLALAVLCYGRNMKLPLFSRTSSAGDESDLQVDKKSLGELAQNPFEGAFVSKKVQLLMAAQDLGTSSEIPMSASGITAYLTRVKAAELDNIARRDLVIARFQEGTPELSTSLRIGLEGNGWDVSDQAYPFPGVTSKSVVLVLDELDTPVMTKIGDQRGAKPISSNCTPLKLLHYIALTLLHPFAAL
ncbi:hypothetical protein HD806DRAFT_543948 [Xylariaceae sp. AK1471]|nr:hypothetical protein HD806DRAFT_543948 [Xylariaceae sp. AK1471]